MKKCIIGKSCGSTCISKSKVCVAEVVSMSQIAAHLEKVNQKAKEERIRKAELEWEIEQQRRQREVDNWLAGVEREDELEDSSNIGEARMSRVPFHLREGTDEINGVPREVWEDVIRTGENLGSGSFGTVYAKGDIAVKVGMIEGDEVRWGNFGSAVGAGPKILGSSVAEGGRRQQGVVVMERVRGWPLHKVEKYSEQLPESFKLKAAESALAQQSKLRDNNVTHNDLHGGNIIITNKGEVKFIDWAFSKYDPVNAQREFIQESVSVDMVNTFFGYGDIPSSASPGLREHIKEYESEGY